ncbi:MAG: Serine-type D-Ala-D-Ala carboxypeptidase [Firmicutes bacterium]|nr:Serine-type D-Ala-D-Ala carboxypeptidase [Bacillota bacterium]
MDGEWPPVRGYCLCLLVCLLLLLPSAPAHGADAPVLPAKAYLLMESGTGRVLYEHDSDRKLPIASTTKIMTAILALEQGKLSDVVTVGRKPYETGGSTLYLEVGEQQTLGNLLYGLMLESGNDAAVAIAEQIDGSEERFVDRMNAKARAIGATHTHFANSHGLHDPNHYSTAYDLALIARYALQNPAFRRIITMEEFAIPGAGQSPPRTLHNHNQLLGYYPGANGVKNGFTEEAGQTNVASARRGQTELIAVVLGAEQRVWTSSMALLDYGFSHFLATPVVKMGEPAEAAGGAGIEPPTPVAPRTLPAPSGGADRSSVPADTPLGPLAATAGILALTLGAPVLIICCLNPVRRLARRFRRR